MRTPVATSASSELPVSPKPTVGIAAARVCVSIAEFVVTSNPNAELITYALGSCVAVIVHDPRSRVGGMIHFRLPLSSGDPDKAREQPATFADTGIPALFRTIYSFGCDKRDLVVKLAGGASMNGDSAQFDIGARNILIARRILWQYRILITAEAVGGQIARTVRLDVESGRCVIRSGGKESEL